MDGFLSGIFSRSLIFWLTKTGWIVADVLRDRSLSRFLTISVERWSLNGRTTVTKFSSLVDCGSCCAVILVLVKRRIVALTICWGYFNLQNIISSRSHSSVKCCHDDEIRQARCNMMVIRLLLYLASYKSHYDFRNGEGGQYWWA